MNQREKMSDKERYKLDMEQLYSHWKLKEPAIRFVPTKSGEGEKINLILKSVVSCAVFLLPLTTIPKHCIH